MRRGRQPERGQRGRDAELRAFVVGLPNPVGRHRRRRSQVLAGSPIRRKPADEAAQRHERVAGSFRPAIRGGHLKECVFQTAHRLSRAGGRLLLVVDQPSGVAEPVTGLQVGNEVPARSIRRVEPAERSRLVRHLAVGLDDGIPFETFDSSGGADAGHRACRVQPRSSRAFPESESPFGQDGRRFRKRGRLGPDGRPDFAARSVRVLRRQTSCSRARGFEGERESGPAAARRSPAPSEGAREGQCAFHGEDDVPCVQRVVSLVSGRRVGAALPRAELAHRTMLLGPPDHVEQRGLELGFRADPRAAIAEIDQFLQHFRKVDTEVTAPVVAARPEQGSGRFVDRKHVTRVDVADVVRIRFGSQARQQPALHGLGRLLDLAFLGVFEFLLFPLELLRSVLQVLRPRPQTVVFAQVIVVAQRTDGAAHPLQTAALAVLDGAHENRAAAT